MGLLRMLSKDSSTVRLLAVYVMSPIVPIEPAFLEHISICSAATNVGCSFFDRAADLIVEKALERKP